MSELQRRVVQHTVDSVGRPSIDSLSQLPQRVDTSESISNDGPSPDMSPGWWTLPIHITCPRCKHHHSSAPLRVSRLPTVYSGLLCANCGHKLLGFGPSSTRTSLLSQETLSNASVDNFGRRTNAHRICTNRFELSVRQAPSNITEGLRAASLVGSSIASPHMGNEMNSPASDRHSPIAQQVPPEQPSRRSDNLQTPSPQHLERHSNETGSSSNTPLNGSQNPDGEKLPESKSAFEQLKKKLRKGTRQLKRALFWRGGHKVSDRVVSQQSSSHRPRTSYPTRPSIRPQIEDARHHAGSTWALPPAAQDDTRPTIAPGSTAGETGAVTEGQATVLHRRSVEDVSSEAAHRSEGSSRRVDVPLYKPIGRNRTPLSAQQAAFRAERSADARPVRCVCTTDCSCRQIPTDAVPDNTTARFNVGLPRQSNLPTGPPSGLCSITRRHSWASDTFDGIGEQFTTYPPSLSIDDEHDHDHRRHGIRPFSQATTLMSTSSNGSLSSFNQPSSSIITSGRLSITSTTSFISMQASQQPLPLTTAHQRPRNLPPLQTGGLPSHETYTQMSNIDEEHTPTGPRAEENGLSGPQGVDGIDGDRTPTTAVQQNVSLVSPTPSQPADSNNEPPLVDSISDQHHDDASTTAHHSDDHSRPSSSGEDATETAI